MFSRDWRMFNVSLVEEGPGDLFWCDVVSERFCGEVPLRSFRWKENSPKKGRRVYCLWLDVIFPANGTRFPEVSAENQYQAIEDRSKLASGRGGTVQKPYPICPRPGPFIQNATLVS